MKYFLNDHKSRMQAFIRARKINACSALLQRDALRLQAMAAHPVYRTFFLPKSDWDIRYIEDPEPNLKEVQLILNQYLQSVYFFEKSRASYGFIVDAFNNRDRRNILTNARRHLNRPYLFQVDLADFFHSITSEMVHQIFKGAPMLFADSLARVLTQLTTYEGRLPMGAPTSPVLSNLACRRLDELLWELAKSKNWVFTRYSDDFTFSSMKPFSERDMFRIRAYIEAEGFETNERKTRLAGPDDEKIVTGIRLNGKGELPSDYLEELRNELQKLANILEMQHYYGVHETQWITKMQQQVQGKIAFAGFVLGKSHPDVQEIRWQYKTATHQPEVLFGAVSWQGFHYLC